MQADEGVDQRLADGGVIEGENRAGAVAHIIGQRALVENFVVRKQPADDLQRDHGEQRQYRQTAKRVVADAQVFGPRIVAAHIAPNVARPVHEVPEPRVTAARHAPHQPEHQQRNQGVAAPVVVLHGVAADQPGDDGNGHADGQRPVKQAQRQIPDTNFHARLRALSLAATCAPPRRRNR